MKKFKDYDSIQAYADIPQLPRGGYICKIMSAEEKTKAAGSPRQPVRNGFRRTFPGRLRKPQGESQGAFFVPVD